MTIRRLVTLLLLTAVFVSPLDAASRRRAVSAPTAGVAADALGIGKLNGASVAGTVASVEGTIITLDTSGGPAIRIDATNAKIVAGDRVIQTIADILPGARVTAFVDGPSASPLQGRLIVVESRPDLMIAGEVEAIDLAASTFTILGVTIAVDEDTQWDTAFPTFAPMRGLEDLRVGNVVKVDASLPGGRILATRVLVVTLDVPERPVNLRGTVKSISDTSWVLTNDDGETTILVNDRTKIAGDPKVGDEVQVIAERNAEGAYVALAIVKIGPIDSKGIEFRGWVNSIGPTEWEIGGPAGLGIPTIKVRITAETVIYAGPKVGDLVAVKGSVGTDRVVVAKSITKVEK